MTKRREVLVIGAGRIGRTAALDLAKDPKNQVTIVDRNSEALNALPEASSLKKLVLDATDAPALQSLLATHPLVVSAVPGWLGSRMVRVALEARCSVVDVAFSAEDPREFDRLAREAGQRLVADCGVAPGLSNIMVGRATDVLDEVQEASIFVGGLPRNPQPPFYYKAPFSPIDVIEEYTRPARYRLNDQIVTVPALSGSETIQVAGLGEIEAFFTDGVRSLLDSLPIPTVIEKTLRYPGHRAQMALLRDAGFFSTDPIAIDERQSVAPREVSQALLFPLWSYQPGEEDLTILIVDCRGLLGGRRHACRFFMLDNYDRATMASSMERTTAYVATAAVSLLLDPTLGGSMPPGLFLPEYFGQHDTQYSFLRHYLEQRGVTWEETLRPVN